MVGVLGMANGNMSKEVLAAKSMLAARHSFST